MSEGRVSRAIAITPLGMFLSRPGIEIFGSYHCASHSRRPVGVATANFLENVGMLVLGWGAPYPKAGVMPRWPRWVSGRAGCPPRGGIRRACGEAPGGNRWEPFQR